MKNEISTYINQEEKREFFSWKISDTDEQLINFMKDIPKFYHEDNGVWRGLSESWYKLYNSLQRENLKHDKIKTFEQVKNTIDKSTYKGVLQLSFFLLPFAFCLSN